MTEMQQHERRLLNEAIEQAYLSAQVIAAEIDLYFFTGDGVIYQLFKNFYRTLDTLFRITSNQEEMTTNAGTEVESMKKCLYRSPPRNDKEREAWMREALEIFQRYDLALVQRGLIVLPHKGK